MRDSLPSTRLQVQRPGVAVHTTAGYYARPVSLNFRIRHCLRPPIDARHWALDVSFPEAEDCC